MRSTRGGVKIMTMRKLELADLSRLAEELKNGETIELLLNGHAIARVEPIREQTDDQVLDELVADGKARKGTGKLPDWFFTKPLIESPAGSVLQQLLDDRQSRDW